MGPAPGASRPDREPSVNDPLHTRPRPGGGLPSSGFGPAQKPREERYKREADVDDQLGLERNGLDGGFGRGLAGRVCGVCACSPSPS